jgi:hypothetical protein
MGIIDITLDSKSRSIVTRIETGKIAVDERVQVMKALNMFGYICQKALEKMITDGKRTGKVYHYKGQTYTAASFGEPPANRTGKLAHSFNYDANANTLTIYSDAFSEQGAPYPWILENKNHPFFQKVIEENSTYLVTLLSDLIKP